jgi:Tfp pilus assembly protein PilO
LNSYTVSEAELSNIVRQITAIAKTQGLVLTQSEFQTSNEGHGGLRQVQITLPVRANYAQVRSFAEAALRQLPMVSVDQIGIKRETIAQASVEVRLKLSVWVDPRKGNSSAPAKLVPTSAGVQLP